MNEIFEVIPECEPLMAAHGLCDLDVVFAWDRGDRLDKQGLESWRQRWRVALTGPTTEGGTYYLKRFKHPPARRQIERWRAGHWRQSTAGVEWDNARRLAGAGIPAAQAVAFGQEMIGPWEVRSFVLLREVPGEALERWVPAHLPADDTEIDRRRRRARVDRLARLVAAFHGAGFVHRDLYLSHVFIQPASTGDDDKPDKDSFCLIDLQRVFCPTWRRRRWAVKDLAALNFSAPAEQISRPERLRFLCRYARLCDRFGSARQLANRVHARTSRLIRRHERLGPSEPRTE